ncbi:hypothetical protein NBRC116597_38130 [Phaeobacter sp. NW0010-22]
MGQVFSDIAALSTGLSKADDPPVEVLQALQPSFKFDAFLKELVTDIATELSPPPLHQNNQNSSPRGPR